jgi:hypothetical protein
VQCGSGLASNTRFCGNCGHAADSAADSAADRAADSEAGVSGQPAAIFRELDQTDPVAETRPGGLPPEPSASPALVTPPAFAAPPVPRSPAGWEESDYPSPGFATPPSFAAPPTGPAYPPPPMPSPAEPPSASPPGYPPPPDRSGPQPQNRAAGPSYPPVPAQYALPAGSPPPPPSPPGETANLSTSWVNEVGLKPRWDQAPAALPLITESRTTGDEPRQRKPLVIGLFVLIAAVLVVPALLIVHAFHGLRGTSAAAAQPTSTRAPSATAAPNERAAASALASLLGQSVTDRDAIVNAVGAVNQCTSGLSQAPKAFQDGASGRQKLLQQLAQLSGRATLPAAMLRELTGAWQASATVDTDLGKWAQDEVSHGCHQNDHNDANFVASNTPDVQASNDKAAFVAMWNPIAAKYGLTRYSTSQL